MDALELATDALAVHRLTRLVTADTITEPVRWALVSAILRRDPGLCTRLNRMEVGLEDRPADAEELVGSIENPPKLAVLLTCRWCAGVWVAGAVVAARTIAPRAWRPLGQAMALASAGALLAGLEDDQ